MTVHYCCFVGVCFGIRSMGAMTLGSWFPLPALVFKEPLGYGGDNMKMQAKDKKNRNKSKNKNRKQKKKKRKRR